MIGIIRDLYTEFRNFITLKFIYPIKHPRNDLKSIVPPNVANKLGIIVRKGVRFNNYSIDIGNYIYIGENTLIDNCARIGSYCSISEGVKLGLKNHPHTHLSTFPLFYSAARGWLANSTYDGDLTKPLIIEPDVLISANAIIMSGIKIGVGAIIGAGAVITKDVPPYSIVVGIPGKVIKYRFEEPLRNLLIESKWWELKENEIRKLKHLFNKPNLFIEQIPKNVKS